MELLAQKMFAAFRYHQLRLSVKLFADDVAFHWSRALAQPGRLLPFIVVVQILF